MKVSSLVNEQEIIRLLRAKDERGAEAFLRRYKPLITYIISPILSDEQDREECISDIVLRVWNRVESYDPERAKWNTWLTAVVRNAAISKARKLRESESMDEEAESGTPSDEPGPEERLIKRESYEALKRALDSLPRQERLMFYRKYYYMQPVSQIASELGMSERAAEGRLYRIRKKLREKLEAENERG